MFEMYKFVDQTRGRDPIIMTGDFNIESSHHTHKFLMSALDLQDVYQDNPRNTCDLVSNVFTKKNRTPKRIDYILYSDAKASSVSLALEVRQGFIERGVALGSPLPRIFFYNSNEGLLKLNSVICLFVSLTVFWIYELHVGEGKVLSDR